MESSSSPYHDSPYQDSPSSSSAPTTSAQAAFEVEASRLRARMPYDRSPPAPVQFPTDMNVGPFVPAIPQMSRSGRPPGAPREPDFYEILNPLNKRLTKLYVSAGVLSAAGVGAISYSWVLIRWEKLFSDAAKGVLLANYEARGLGGVVCLLFPGSIYCIANLASIINHSAPLPDIVGAIANSALSALLTIFVLLASYDLKHEGQEHAQEDGKWSPCLSPGADQWKRLSCEAANDKVRLMQLLGLLAAASATFLYLVMAILHAVETKKNAGSGRWLERRKGYVRLEQNSLDPYQIHEDDDADSEESRTFK